MFILSVLEWAIWSISLLGGLWFALGIRQTALRRRPTPTWPTLILSLALIALPIMFLFLPFSKLHIIWLLIVTWPLSFMAGVGYIPLISQLLIWPAYFYASILMIGTGVRLSSPSKQSPWAARLGGMPLRYLVKGWFQGFTHRRSPGKESNIARIMESRTPRTRMTEQIWRNLLASDDLGEPLVASHEVDDVVSLMVEAKIDPQKFDGNLSSLITRGMPIMADLFGGEKLSLPTTPSVNKYISIVNRPLQVPIWLLAGFPDVLAWLNEQQKAFLDPSVDEDEAATSIAKLFGFDVESSQDLSESDFENPDGSLRARYYRNLVRNYIQQTGCDLEATVEEGSDGDIYLGMDFLQMIGEESNFTLIATVTTKYYMELKKSYASSFSDETSLLAMSGILDANVYVLGTGQIQPEQIVDLAKATQGEKDRLLEFMVQFEALLMSIDTPELFYEEILEACRDQVDAIQKSIKNTMATYQGEPKIVNDARSLMTSPKFGQLRSAASVRTP